MSQLSPIGPPPEAGGRDEMDDFDDGLDDTDTYALGCNDALDNGFDDCDAYGRDNNSLGSEPIDFR